MTRKQLRIHRRKAERQRRKPETKPEPYSRADEYRFGVLSKRDR